MTKKPGWYKESKRHSLAARGIKTKTHKRTSIDWIDDEPALIADGTYNMQSIDIENIPRIVVNEIDHKDGSVPGTDLVGFGGSGIGKHDGSGMQYFPQHFCTKGNKDKAMSILEVTYGDDAEAMQEILNRYDITATHLMNNELTGRIKDRKTGEEKYYFAYDNGDDETSTIMEFSNVPYTYPESKVLPINTLNRWGIE